ncbi:MAG: TolC family protein [bacterium]|nr:TolC family protein [bacterium]
MRANLRPLTLTLITALILLATAATKAEEPRLVNFGYFEAGNSSYHTLLRGEIKRLLENRIGDSLKFRFVPDGFGSVGWDRDSCRTIAAQLAASSQVDIFLTAGPWVVEDLLNAGCKKPIVALHRFDPLLEQLLDSRARPRFDNLTAHYRPQKMESDLELLVELTGAKKIGFLLFPSDSGQAEIVRRADEIARTLGAEILFTSETNNSGSYAFFKSYEALKKESVDAVYLGPLWGMDNVQRVEFLSSLSRDRIPSLSWEGDIPVQRGALASGAGVSFVGEAHAAADKIMQIIGGAKASDLPTIYPQQSLLVINSATADSCRLEFPQFLLLDAQLIRSGAPEESEMISLEQALGRALNSHPSQLAIDDLLEVASREKLSLKSEYLPQISAQVSAFHLDDNRAANSHGWIQSDGYSAAIALDQTILSLEKLRAIKSADASIALAKSQQLESRMALEQAVTAAYLGYLQAYEESKIVSKDREHIRLYQEISRARALTHPDDSIDILRWEIVWHDATSRMVEADYHLRSARAILTSLLNLPENYPFLVDSVSFSDEKMFTTLQRLYTVTGKVSNQEKLRETLVTTALSNSANLKTYDSRLNLQKRRLEEKSAARYPTFQVGTDFRMADSLEDYPAPFEEQSSSWSLYGLLKFPLWLGGKNSHEKKKLQAQYSLLEYARDSASLETRESISSALYQMYVKSEQMPVVFRKRRAARPILDQSVSRYERGKTGILDLIDAQRNVAQSELQMISTRYQFFHDMSKLAHAVGWNFDKNSSFDQAFMAWLSDYYAAIKEAEQEDGR